MKKATISAMCALFAAGAAAAEEEGKGDPRLGPEVDRVCFASSINNFQPLKGVDDVVLLERGAGDWYRVELLGACSYNRIRSAQKIGIRTLPGGGCLRRGDDIIFAEAFARADAPLDRVSCRVEKISRWDPKAKAPDAPAQDAPAQ